MATIHDLVIDCAHPASLARFWAAVLDGYDVSPYDEAELARLRAAGVDGPDDDPTVLVEAPGRTPRLWFQRVPEPKAGKNRLHLDLRSDDPVAEAARLESLGALRLANQPNDDVIGLLDPEGNELCLIREAAGG